MTRFNALALAALLSAALPAASPRAGDAKPDAAKPAAAPAPEVGVVTVKPRDIVITAELNGRATPYLVAEVRPQVDGIIRDRIFNEGSDVVKDTRLYQIDPAVYQAQLDAAKANLDKALANAEVSHAEEARYKQMVKLGADTQEKYDQVVANYKQALADIQVAKAQITLAQTNLDYTRVLAPISGRIGKSAVTVGALVTAGQPSALATIQQLDPIYVDIAQPSRDFLQFKKSLARRRVTNTGASYGSVRVRLEGGELYEHAGEVRFADVSVDQSTSSILLRASFPNPDHTLLPGMYVRVLLEVDHVDGALLVPQTALSRSASGQATVLAVTPDNTVESRKVVASRTFEDQWIVTEGVKAGDRVVVDGLQRIRIIPGAPPPKVSPTELPAKAPPPGPTPATPADPKPAVSAADAHASVAPSPSLEFPAARTRPATAEASGTGAR